MFSLENRAHQNQLTLKGAVKRQDMQHLFDEDK